MQTVAASLVFASIAAQAAGPAPAGSIGTIQVEYRFESKGESATREKWAQWVIERFASIAAEVTAQKPTSMATMVAPDGAQTAARQKKLEQAAGSMQAMQPMMQQAEKIAAKCRNDEACMEREVQKMGMGMSEGDLARAQSAGQKAQAALADGPATVQLWRPKSQTGTYRIKEDVQRQFLDPLCNGKPGMKCRRSEQRQGEGTIPGAPGRADASTAMAEVDHAKNTLTLLLPVWMNLLPVEQVVTSDYASDNDRGKRSVLSVWRLVDAKAITVPLSARGEQVHEMVDNAGFPGRLTVRWTFTAAR
ncbi:MAG: hypothetical protein LCI02_03675 [Proteobacteria bacterium]|nr:hypothetical protein [Pseudomonadota bacterium]